LYERHPPRFEYFLTDKGRDLGPVLDALYGWGERYG
jgi:DNA-binding HxlR family transcriptional regulator